MKFIVTLKNSDKKFLVKETKKSRENNTRGLTDMHSYTLEDNNSNLYKANDLRFICLVFPNSVAQFKLNLCIGKPVSFMSSTLGFLFGREPETEHNLEKNYQTRLDFYEPINKNIYPNYEIFTSSRDIVKFCKYKNISQIKEVADKQNEGFRYKLSDIKYYYPRISRTRTGNLVLTEPKAIISKDNYKLVL